MTVIDKYIFNHPGRPAAKLAEEIGVSETFVKCRRLSLTAADVVSVPISTTDEIHALINLISVRGEGWAVEAAKERIRILNTHQLKT
ncbi:hypothetical protein SNE25_21175 [Mucilaginibacter sabulilitoris]|uniref:Uncharacterized protein n=1 Tax=Mucilaginibacter sabulilitoris TaxID=1173583 RepID=A0ABZ0THZ1_9SPHI|nr:hypothetical protein [Mucilaginibacter sabulilitoris]WPU91833.1 hypothetical protein SNE25_21175 [Mucilaginibacter sabulilitoris]